jgi:hypothetical protein
VIGLILSAIAVPDVAPLSLHVLEGCVEVASSSGVAEVPPGAPALELRGPGYIESRARSRFETRFESSASATWRGCAVFEWRAPVRCHAGVLLDVLRADEVELEVRRGPLRVLLPGGWSLQLEQGAAYARRRGDGTYELVHTAGTPILVGLESAPGRVQPPWTVLPGVRVTLDSRALDHHARVLSRARSAQRREEDRDVHAKPWPSFSWPWMDTAEPAHVAPPSAASATTAPAPAPDAAQPPASSRALRLTPWGPRWTRVEPPERGVRAQRIE